MKKLNFRRFLLLFATFALGLGFATSVKGQKEITKASADTITEGTALYLKPNSNWLEDNARFAAYFYGVGDKWTDFVVIDEEHKVYKTVSPEGSYTNFVIARMIAGTQENKWDNRWNQTINLDFTDGNFFTINPEQWGVHENGATVTPSIFDSSSVPTPAPFFMKNETIYFAANEEWHLDEEYKIAAYFFNKLIYPAASKFVEMESDRDNIYKVDVPDDVYNYVLFVQLKDLSLEWGVGNNGEQTGDLAHVVGKNLYIQNHNFWYEFDEQYASLQPTAEGINKDRIRIWVNRNGHFESDIYSLLINDVYYAPTGYIEALVSYHEDETVNVIRSFAYFDLPSATVNGKEVKVIITYSQSPIVFRALNAGVFAEGDNSKLWTVEYDEGFTVTKGALAHSEELKVKNTFLAKVLEGYLSCYASLANGYYAFDLMNENFFNSGNLDNVDGFLTVAPLLDYHEDADYTDNSVERATETNAQAKYDMMALQASGVQLSILALEGLTSTPNPNATFAIFFVSVLVAFGYIYFILPRKKKA